MNVASHPEPQVMAAFVEGALTPQENDWMEAHLRDCAECRDIAAGAAAFVDEENARSRPTRVDPMWWLAAAAVFAAIAIPVLLRWNDSRRAPLARLIASAPRDHRTIQPRLSGFGWARLQAPVRGRATPVDPSDLRIQGAAGDVLDRAANAKDADSLHAAGVAFVLIGRPADAITPLRQAATKHPDARTWNDLAAAQYAQAVAEDRQAPLIDAMEAVSNALRLDDNDPEALFNRALILERLGVRDRAAAAWKHYLDVDPNSGWSDEARAHLRALTTSSRFDPRLLRTTPADALVRDFPQEARTWGEVVLLGDWADGDATALARARAIGDALVRRSGEHLLADAVAAIDRAGASARADLADAHRTYRAAKKMYSQRKAAAAEEQFRRAAMLFERGGSPMALVARYFAASAAFDQGRGDEARDALIDLVPRAGSGYRALAAQIRWTLAVDANAAGDWGAAVRNADAASEVFRALGERANAAAAGAAGAYAVSVIGDADGAWKRWGMVLSGVCDGATPDRCNALIDDAADTLAVTQRARAAVALLDLTIEERRSSDDAVLVFDLAKRARILGGNGGRDDAQRSLAEARQALGRVADPSMRAMLANEIDVEEAALRIDRDPRGAVATFDRAAAVLREHDIKLLLPHVLLERARAHRVAHELDDAARDYAAAVGTTAAEQLHIDDPTLRLTLLDTATEAIEESIELALARGRTDEAFAIADRRHGLAGSGVPALARDEAVIEYAVLPHSLAIFCATAVGVTETSVDIDRSHLAEQANAFTATIRRRAPMDDIERTAAALRRLLIAPVEASLGGARTLVIVPDRELHAVPFAALYNGRFLIEEFDLRIAPAAAHDAQRATTAVAPALVVADPAVPGMPQLPAARDEAARIAAMFGAALLAGDAATATAFLDDAPRSALIHYAAHADSDTTRTYAALLLSDDAVSASRIARLRLERRPLVVLAACGTFRGDMAHVAGMSSLARAFLIAGARCVVATLWEIDDDAAAPLFLRFHESIRAGASPAHALRDAQLAMLRSADARLREPASWCAVVDVESA